MNQHTTPYLDDIVARLRRDIDLKVQVQHLKAKFCNNAETMQQVLDLTRMIGRKETT